MAQSRKVLIAGAKRRGIGPVLSKPFSLEGLQSLMLESAADLPHA
jgi:hypothetical protein